MKKRRADEALIEQLALEKIELARALIMEGRVMAGDRKILRASEMIGLDGEACACAASWIPMSAAARTSCSVRSEVFGHRSDGNNVCIDVGASTGGFTDVMLRAGATESLFRRRGL